jgi:hypothetical protein
LNPNENVVGSRRGDENVAAPGTFMISEVQAGPAFPLILGIGSPLALAGTRVPFGKVLRGYRAGLEVERRNMKSQLEAPLDSVGSQLALLHRVSGIVSSGLPLAYLDLRSESRRLRRPMRELAEAIIIAEDLHRKGERKELFRQPSWICLRSGAVKNVGVITSSYGCAAGR